MGWLDSFTDSVDMSLSKLQETVKDWEAVLQSMRFQRVRHNLMTEQQRGSCQLWFSDVKTAAIAPSMVSIVHKSVCGNRSLIFTIAWNSVLQIYYSVSIILLRDTSYFQYRRFCFVCIFCFCYYKHSLKQVFWCTNYTNLSM